MKPISAEDFAGEGMSKRWMGIAALLVSFLLAISPSLSLTSFSISDNAQGSYIVVVMLMLLFFIVFSAKENLDIDGKWINIVYGAILAAVFFILTSYLRGKLSYLFLSYRIDALLFPIILASLIVAIFGIKGIKRMKWLIVYSVFASPVILIPVLSLNGSFTVINAQFVYSLLKLIGAPVIRNGLVIAASSGSAITISRTCTDIAAFVAIVMFLLPIAYLLEGKRKSKFIWIISAVVLLLFLNVIRMLIISIEWMYYGIGPAVSLFHLFAGQILFDIAIVIMVLLFPKFRLSMPKPQRTKRLKRHDMPGASRFVYLIFGILLGLFFLSVNLPYLQSVSVPYTSFMNSSSTISNQSLSLLYLSIIKSPDNYSVSPIGRTISNSVVFGIYNGSRDVTGFMLMSDNGSVPFISPKNTSLLSSYILNDGIALNVYSAYLNGSALYINTFSIPGKINGLYVLVSAQEIAQPGPEGGCVYSGGTVDRAESVLYTLMESGTRYGSTVLCTSYYTASAT